MLRLTAEGGFGSFCTEVHDVCSSEGIPTGPCLGSQGNFVSITTFIYSNAVISRGFDISYSYLKCRVRDMTDWIRFVLKRDTRAATRTDGHASLGTKNCSEECLCSN